MQNDNIIMGVMKSTVKTFVNALKTAGLAANVAVRSSPAIVVGAGNYFEIWAPVFWQAQVEMLVNTEANKEKFSVLNISSND